MTTLAHHVDLAWMMEAYRRTRKDGATGVDRQTAVEFATKLEGNLRELLELAKSGRYQAPPVRPVGRIIERVVRRFGGDPAARLAGLKRIGIAFGTCGPVLPTMITLSLAAS